MPNFTCINQFFEWLDLALSAPLDDEVLRTKGLLKSIETLTMSNASLRSAYEPISHTRLGDDVSGLRGMIFEFLS